MRIVDLSATLDLREVDSLLATDDEEQSVNKVVQDILNDVRKRKDQAVCEYTRRFDEFDLTPDLMRVPPEHIREYATGADDELVEILRKAIHNIRDFHEQQVEESWEYYAGDGVRLGLRRTPIASAGVYIPGGKAAYPSTVLMDVIPARIAGVKEIILVTPPQADGWPDPRTLAAAHLAGIRAVATQIERLLTACATTNSGAPMPSALLRTARKRFRGCKRSSDRGIDTCSRQSGRSMARWTST